MSRSTDYSRRKGRDQGPSFLQIYHFVYDCPAYRDLARLIHEGALSVAMDVA
jgi:hypothetical protein